MYASQLCRIAVTLALCLLMPACAHPAPAATAAASAGPVETVVPTQSAPPVSTPTPTASAIPEPTAEPVTPRSDEYYVVERNGRRGVVDGQGRDVLPAAYASIDVLRSGEEAGYAVGFFAIATQAAVGAQPQGGNTYGALLDGRGKEVVAKLSSAYTDRRFIYAYVYGQGSELVGVFDFTGHTIVPLKYQSILPFGDLFAAVRRDPPTGEASVVGVDIYNAGGKLLRSGSQDVRGAVGEYLIAFDKTGKCALTDANLKRVTPAEWDWVDPAGPDTFIVRKAGLIGLMDIGGKLLLPAKYQSMFAQPDPDTPGGLLVTASDAAGAYLFDGDGSLLLHSAKYRNFYLQGGMLFAQDAGNMMHALDRSGNEILPPAGYLMWNEQDGMYERIESDNGGYEFYTRDGQKLPLPGSVNAVCVTPDRFLFLQAQTDGPAAWGLCDSAGVVLVLPQYAYMTVVPGQDLIVFSVSEGKGPLKYGLMDLDGRILLSAMYDTLYPDYSGQRLLHAAAGPFAGLIDARGNWVWYTSIYDDLED